MSDIDRYIEMLRHKNRRFEVVAGQLFFRKNQWIEPFGPVAQAYHVDEVQGRALLCKLGGLWVMWTDGFSPDTAGSEWYAVICRRHRPQEEIADKNRRYEIRRALQNCEVRKVDAEEIAEHGYATYCAARHGYGSASPPLSTEHEFRKRVNSDAPFGDLRHHWGVYCDGKMVAFEQNYVYGRIEVDYSTVRVHPDYQKHYPMYALLYKMNEYYLAQEGFQYVNAGFRSIYHDTGIQEFLMKKFGFEPARTGLHLHFRPPFGRMLQMARPFGGAIARLVPKAKPLFELMRMSCPPGRGLGKACAQQPD